MIEWIGCDGLKQWSTQLVEQTQTVNDIGDEGARGLSDALKVNTTLTTLNLECEQEWWSLSGLDVMDSNNEAHNLLNKHKAGNRIGDEGAGALSDALKVNRALATLNLASEQTQEQWWWLSGLDVMDWNNEAHTLLNNHKQATALGQKEQVHCVMH